MHFGVAGWGDRNAYLLRIYWTGASAAIKTSRKPCLAMTTLAALLRSHLEVGREIAAPILQVPGTFLLLSAGKPPCP